MAIEYIRLKVTLIVAGPVFSAGSTVEKKWIDKSFYRDWRGRYALPGSLIRGKLKEAMKSFPDTYISSNNIEWLFGLGATKDGTPDSWAPHRGMLYVSDFCYAEKQKHKKKAIRTRIRIENETGVVESGALLFVENPFEAGEETRWIGELSFYADRKNSSHITDLIKTSLLFISNIGADKTIGYGRLEQVKVELISEKNSGCQVASGALSTPARKINLAISPQEPIMVGGVRHSNNVFVSERNIPGSVIKGALAAGLNKNTGAKISSYIDEDNMVVRERFPLLCKYFGELVFLQATPSLALFQRSKAIPLSGVQYRGQYDEVSFLSDSEIYTHGKEPACFQVDWKNIPEKLPEEYKIPELEYHHVTRTAIDEKYRRAKYNNLYSFNMIKPCVGSYDEVDSHQVFWNSEIRFPDSIPSANIDGVVTELSGAIKSMFHYIGKRQSRINITFQRAENRIIPEISKGAKFAIYLQASALIINPEVLSESMEDVFDDELEIKHQYEDYWENIFKGTATLDTYFARQHLEGGYQGMRFMDNHYQPILFTSPGSTFVFTANQPISSETLTWLYFHGLPSPDWSDRKKKVCLEKGFFYPFVSSNGYGEIHIGIKS